MSTVTTPPPPRVSHVAKQLAKDRLGVPMIVGHALSGSAPLTVVAAGTTTGYAITGNQGLPLIYAVVAVALMLFSVGFVAMSRHIVNAGSFYTYIAHGMGSIIGVGAAFIAKLGYNSMQVGLYGGFGALAATFATNRFGATWAWWAWALTAWLVVGLCGLLRIDVNGLVLAIVLACEIALVFVYDVVMLAHPAAEGYSLSALSPTHLAAASFGAAAVTALAGFVGFEATTVFSEEARDPKRTIARATYLSLIIVGLLYAGSAFAMTIAAGPSNIIATAGEKQTELLFFLASPHLSTFFIDAGHLLVITSLFAALLAFHNTCARYSFALGRERVLPPGLATTGMRTGAPKAGSLFQSFIGLAVIVGFAIAGLDPVVHLFFWLTTYGGLGVLILMVLTCGAIIGYFSTAGREHHESLWRALIAPCLAILVLAYILATTVTSYHNLLGVPEGHPAAILFPAAMLVTGIVGMLWAVWLRFARPDIYQSIGLGASASTIGVRRD